MPVNSFEPMPCAFWELAGSCWTFVNLLAGNASSLLAIAYEFKHHVSLHTNGDVPQCQ